MAFRRPTQMKSRVGGSISQLFAGAGGCGISKALSFKPKFDLFHDRGQINRNLLQGFESLKRSIHSSFDGEDDFSELGPPVAQGRGALSKLMTEKPEPTLNKKALAGWSSYAESHLSVRNALLSLGKPSPSCPKPEKNDIPGLSADSKCDYNFNDSNSISIENVPTTVDLAQLIEAVLIYGKVSSACMRTSPNGLRCELEFENLSSSRRAVTVGLVNIRGNRLPIRPSHVQETFVIRINSISKETTDPTIHALCKSIGPLEGLVRAGKDVVDAIFSLKNNPDIQGILAKLNDTFLDNCQWSACLRPRNSIPTENPKNEDAKSRLGSEIENCLAAVKAKHSLKGIHILDLQKMHTLITHLEGQPAVSR